MAKALPATAPHRPKEVSNQLLGPCVDVLIGCGLHGSYQKKKDMEHGMETGLHGLVQGLHASMVRGFKVILLVCRFRSLHNRGGTHAC